MNAKHVMVFITAPSVETAQNIANTLVDKGLAACVNILSSIQSIYLWQGNKQSDEETLLIAKTTQDLFLERLVPTVQEMHPYQVPEIIALPIVLGSEKYLEWIEESTQKSHPG